MCKNANSNPKDRDVLQGEINQETLFFETRLDKKTTVLGVDFYYTNDAFPALKAADSILTVNYYDSYATSQSSQAIYDTPTTKLKGLATESHVRVLGTDDWILTRTFYDKKARPIQVITENDYLKTVDILAYKLDFVGRVLESQSNHKDGLRNSIFTRITERFDYDHTGRLLKHTPTLIVVCKRSC